MTLPQCYIGVDVSKNWIDVFAASTQKPSRIANRQSSLAEWVTGLGEVTVIASLIETCKLNGIEPLGYLTDVLTRIVDGHPNSRIDDPLPWAYVTKPELKAVA